MCHACVMMCSLQWLWSGVLHVGDGDAGNACTEVSMGNGFE